MWQQWSAVAEVGADIFLDRAAALAVVPLGRGHPYELSLVSTLVIIDDEQLRNVIFVHCLGPSSRQGRGVRIDENGQGVYPAGVPRKEFVGAEIVHPSIGYRTAKAKGPDRTAIPDRMIRLQSVASVLRGTDVLNACICDCPVEEYSDGWTCPACLLSWHGYCRLQVLCLQVTQSLRGPHVPPVEMPLHFNLLFVFFIGWRTPQSASVW